MFYDKMRVVIFEIVKDDGQKIVVCLCVFVFRGAVTFRDLVFFSFQLQVTIFACGKEKVSGEVSDLVILMGECFVAVCANGGRPVLRQFLRG